MPRSLCIALHSFPNSIACKTALRLSSVKHWIVENDLDDQDFFRVALHDAVPHAALDVVSNATAALNRLRIKPYIDAIVVDVNIPGFSGIELCTMIHRDPEMRNIPVYFLTTASDPATHKACTDAGAAHVYCKPTGIKELYEIARAIAG